MKWESNRLLFQVYRKEDQQLKYMDQQSTHRPTTFKSIATGVYTRLSRLTSYSDSTAKMPIDKLYPDHAAALKSANLLDDNFPKFGEVWADLANNVAMEKKRWKWKNNQSVFFVMGFSNVCRFLRIPKLMKKLKKRYKLSWLRVNMAYRHFTNLRERFSSDLTGKLNSGLKSLDFMSQPCNCNIRSKVNGQCAFNKQCHTKVLVYKITCLCCNHVYIGVTQ